VQFLSEIHKNITTAAEAEKEFFTATSKLIFNEPGGGGCQMERPEGEDFQAVRWVRTTLAIVFKVLKITGTMLL
jgi:hypothetical protein